MFRVALIKSWDIIMNKEKEITKEKLRKNTQHVMGITALRKIRVLVDEFDAKERKNKKRSIVFLIISVLILLWFVNDVINRKPNYQNINTSQNYSVIWMDRAALM